MPKITINYEEQNDRLEPIRMVIYFGPGKIQWTKSIYVPLEAPFQRQRSEDYNTDAIGVTVTQGDLILDPSRPNHFGIYFPHIVNRIEKMISNETKKSKLDEPYIFNYEEVSQLVIYISDLDEVMQMDRNYFEWSE